MQASCIAYYFSGLKYAEKTGVDSQRDCVAFEIDRLKVWDLHEMYFWHNGRRERNRERERVLSWFALLI